MAGISTAAGDIARDYLSRFPMASNSCIARMLRSKYPKLFSSDMAASRVVRYWRGASGKEDRRKTKNHIIKREMELPEEVGIPWEPYRLPFRKARGIVMADLHIPYYSRDAVIKMMKHGKDRKATDFILLDGDVADCYKLSSFEKDPSKRNFCDELDAVRQFFSEVSRGKWKVIWKHGNHEYRLTRTLFARAPELFGVDSLTWESLVNTKVYGIDVVPQDTIIWAGKLNIIHGHETKQCGAGITVNPARTQFLRTKECVLSADSHRPSTHTEVSVRGRPITSWSIGCACQLHPEYSRVNNWSWGYAVLTVDGDDFEVENYRMLPRGDVVPA